MPLQNTSSRWGLLAQGFHWLIALLIFAAWLTHALHEDAPRHSTESAMWMDMHKACGLSVFMLFWFRLLWRLKGPVPAPVVVAPWQDKLSRLVHLGLYVAMIAMPTAGILLSEFGNHPVPWFGVFTLPQFVTPDKDLAGLFHVLHTDVFWLFLLGLLGLHVGAVVWHQFFLKDRLLQRMLPGQD